MEIKCDNCGRKFEKPPWEIKRSKRHYCSPACQSQGRITKVSVSCAYCGADFLLKRSRANALRYCNVGCYNKGRSYGRYVGINGYWLIGKKYEHRLLIEKELGRKLTSDEAVHHIDEDRQNNTLSNLALTTRGGHNTIHKGKNPGKVRLIWQGR